MNEMSTADAANAIGQLLNAFKGLRHGEALIAKIATLDQAAAEANAAAERAKVNAATETQIAEEARLRAARVSDECTARIEAAQTNAAAVEAECKTRVSAAQAEANRVMTEERRATEKAVAEFAGMIDAERATLADVKAQLDDARQALAAIKAKFG